MVHYVQKVARFICLPSRLQLPVMNHHHFHHHPHLYFFLILLCLVYLGREFTRVLHGSLFSRHFLQFRSVEVKSSMFGRKKNFPTKLLESVNTVKNREFNELYHKFLLRDRARSKSFFLLNCES